VDAVRAVLRSSDQPIVLCGHSYGGVVVVTEAAAGEPARKRAAQVVELEAGHHPFLSRPAELAAVIAGAAFS